MHLQRNANLGAKLAGPKDSSQGFAGINMALNIIYVLLQLTGIVHESQLT